MRVILVGCYRQDPASPVAASADRLAAALKRAGHDTDTIWLPFEPAAPRAAQLFGIRLLQFTDWCDRVIALDAPSAVVTHQSKTVWRLDDFALADADEATLAAYASGWSEARPALSVADLPPPQNDAGWDAAVKRVAP